MYLDVLGDGDGQVPQPSLQAAAWADFPPCSANAAITL